jgi:hemoglobin-like flavoprotein
MTPETVRLVQSSWAKVESIAAPAAALFYDELFQRDASLKQLFKSDMVKQGERLMQMIGLAVTKLDQPDTLVAVLRNLGQRHLRYGVQEQHYTTVGAALIATLEKGLGPAFTPEVRAAWLNTYGAIARIMTTAAGAAQAA